jgi:hypothetical protein
MHWQSLGVELMANRGDEFSWLWSCWAGKSASARRGI